MRGRVVPLAVSLGCAVVGTVAWLLAEPESSEVVVPSAAAPTVDEVVVPVEKPAAVVPRAVEPVRERRRVVPATGSETESDEVEEERVVWDIDPLTPDVSGAGDARLRMRLVDADSGEPVESRIRLWRLGLPESATLTAGDAVYADERVPEEGLVLEAVPRGRYRVQCSDQRRGAEDPPEFVVDSTDVEVACEVTMPRTSVATLTVYDESGALVPEGNLELRVRSSSGSRERVPDWAQARRRKGANRGRYRLSHGVG